MFRKMKLDNIVTPHTRINSKWIKDLNVRPETIKVLEKMQAAKSWTLLGAIFYWIYLPRQGKQKNKINKWDYIQLKSFCTAKEKNITK